MRKAIICIGILAGAIVLWPALFAHHTRPYLPDQASMRASSATRG